jgi:hypothetical protein
VCGNPTITVDDIRVQCQFQGILRSDVLIDYLFDALGKFGSSAPCQHRVSTLYYQHFFQHPFNTLFSTLS